MLVGWWLLQLCCWLPRWCWPDAAQRPRRYRWAGAGGGDGGMEASDHTGVIRVIPPTEG